MLEVAAGGCIQQLLCSQNCGEETGVITGLTHESGGERLGRKGKGAIEVKGNAFERFVEIDQFPRKVTSAVIASNADKDLGAITVCEDVVIDRARSTLSDLAGFPGAQEEIGSLVLRSHA